MRKSRLLSLLLIVTLIVPFSTVVASTTTTSQVEAPKTNTAQTPAAQPVAAAPTPPDRAMPAHVVEIDPETLQELSPEEIIAQYGYVPRALADQVKGQSMMMIIELKQAPLAVYYAEQKAAAREVNAANMTAYTSQLAETQALVQSQLETLGVKIVSEPLTTVYNGFLAYVPLEQTNTILALDNVKAVHRAPEHTVELNNSVPLIGAPEVWDDLGYDGEGVTIAVIDTGIDYTHAVFGGSGDPDDYADNDPDVIETGTFSTTKVVAGWDFAGTLYHAGCTAADKAAGICTDIPAPDPDPLDENGHGTHVSSIAAGIAAGQVMTGVAPMAKLMALKIFGASGSTNLTMNALDMATNNYMQYGWPQVINMSLGSSYGPGDVDDPSVVATNNAVATGIVVAASIGNSANVPYIAGSPGTSTGAIGTASSMDGFAVLDGFLVNAPSSIAIVHAGSQSVAYDWTSSALPVTGKLVYPLAGANPAQDQRTGCYTFDITNTQIISGNVVLLDWTDPSCGGSVARAANAVAAGAIGVFMADNSDIFDLYITGSAVVPAYSIPKGTGTLLKNTLTGEVVNVTLTAEYQGSVQYREEASLDIIAASSSRGPRGTDSKLKPDVTAPGDSIFAADMGTGTKGVSYSGTSMASPHIAGVAALMVQAHPNWTPEQIKAAMMNTAVDLVDNSPIPRQGAGRVRAYEAVNTPVVAVGEKNAVSLSEFFLAGADEYVITRTVTLQNLDTAFHAYAVGWSYQGASLRDGLDVSFSTSTVMPPPGGKADVLVTFTFDAAQLPVVFNRLEEVYGYITFRPGAVHKIYLPLVMRNATTNVTTVAAAHSQAQVPGELRVPFYFVPRPYTTLNIAAQTVIADPATDAATFEITHTGPISSSLWAFPLLASDPKETGTAGDVRAFGADFGWNNATYGPIIAFAIDAWAPWHTAYTGFAEFDLYIDNNEDGNPEFVIYNYPVGDGTYIPRVYALQTGLTSRYSPYLIHTDYNSGYMEFYVPASYLGLGPTNTTFDYQLFGYDYDGEEDEVAPGSFDYARPPFAWDYTGDPGPANHTASMEVEVDNLAGYAYSQPEGVMIVDYVGHPNNGGQAYLYPITLPNIDAVTILHTNDFHGQLEASGSGPGIARVASVVNNVRATQGADNVLLVDAGDEMQGSLLSNLSKGAATIDLFNFVGYQAATFGNHEFDWGQPALISRTQQANYPFLATNLVVSDTGDCATAGWTVPSFTKPWITMTVGAPGNEVVIGLIGVTSQETPYITIAEATQGLCFKDAATSIAHYYDAVKAAGAEVLVVISHLGNTDGGYGYGIPVYGDQTLAKKLVEASKPVDLIIGGHSHTNLSAAQVVSGTTVVQAHYNGRRVGRANIIYNRLTQKPTITWQSVAVNPPPTPPATQPAATLFDAATAARLKLWTNDPDYLALINTVIGFTKIDLTRKSTMDNTMGAFVNDAIYNELNNDAEAGNDVDMVFNNSGGLRADIIATGAPTTPYTLTYGALFTVLPFGNQTIVGDMTGAQIMELLNQSATLFKGTLQVAGIRFKYYSYGERSAAANTDSYHNSWWAWGAYDVKVKNGAAWESLVMTQTYRVATNEFLAPAGQDGFTPFKYMTNISYWGDMLNQVLSWTSAHYGTPAAAYNGPLGNGTLLDGRITREGDNVSGPIIPVTILHHNDSHGRLSPSGSAPGYTNLATVIRQEWAYNPTRTILLHAGDSIQGDAMAAFYKAAFTGKGADGTTLPITLTVNPILAAMNALTYTAMTLGNHEYNFGGYIFTGTLGQANFPLLQANVYDDGRYGLEEVGVKPFVTVTVGAENISLAVLGIGNHRIPQYELPSNIPGLTFTNPITETQNRAPALQAAYDAVVALTHIGFTEDPKSVEVDENVDTNLAAVTTGIDVIIGGHSHTNPSTGFGPYKYLPTFVGSANNVPVLINQAYRYNTYLGEVVLGMRAKTGGGYEVVARAGKYVPVTTNVTPDPAVKAIVQPYEDFLTVYKSKILGQTTVPLDALNAYTQETNAANLQADASKWKLEKELPVSIDFHLSGAMTNGMVAGTATPSTPYTLTVGDMFTLMPYENSLLVMEINGAQLKAILERGYRNYWYYKNVPNHGGYSYYTTCMLDVSAGAVITYTDDPLTYTVGMDHIAGMSVNGVPIDFTAATTYTVSTVNYLAAGSCNFSNKVGDAVVSLWPLAQTLHDTQYYVRDVVIEYIPTRTQPISPQIEGRLRFIAP